MIGNIRETAKVITLMDAYLRTSGKIPEEKLWENTYANRQINRRRNGESFPLCDHARAMVYSMLSAERGWAGVDTNPALKAL